jgi:hypothetical protein
MKTKKLTEVLERVEACPADVQNELAEFALELDAGFRAGEYEPTSEELCVTQPKAVSPAIIRSKPCWQN